MKDVQRHIVLVQHKIVNVLMLNPNGLGMIRLAKKVGLDRGNIGTHLKNLIQSGYVKRENGLRGKYFLTNKVFKNPLLSSAFMAESFTSELLAKPDLILSDLKTVPETTDFRALLPHFHKEEFGLYRNIFEIVNQIGAYIIYVLIQAMNPANEHIQEVKYLKKDDIIIETLRFAITPIISHLLYKFKDVIHLELRSLIGDTEDPLRRFIEYSWTVPQFQLRQDSIDELVSAYSHLYPSIFSELEKLKASLPHLIQAYNYHNVFLQMQQEFQKTCRHIYVDDVSRMIDSNGRKYWAKYHKSPEKGKSIVHCIRCHHTTYQKLVTSTQHKSYVKFLK